MRVKKAHMIFSVQMCLNVSHICLSNVFVNSKIHCLGITKTLDVTQDLLEKHVQTL